MNKHYFRTGLKCSLFLCLFSLSIVTRASSANDVVKGEFFVKYRSGMKTRAATILKRAGGQRKKSFSIIDGLQLWQIEDVTDSGISALSSDSSIEYIEPNYIMRKGRTPEVPYLSEQWGLDRINLTGAWEVYQPNAEVIVAVIDSGIDHTHPSIKANMWVNLREMPNNDEDDDDNGYDDDIHGYDFTNDDSKPFDDNFHGTHCAGIIAAIASNSGRINSNPIKIMALKVLDDSGHGKADDAIEAIEYAIDNGAQIINGSWGNAHGTALQEVFQAAQDAGILVITAAGNDLQDTDVHPYYPASYPLDNIISVAAIGRHDELATFDLGGSNYGRHSVDLGAPGVSISSSVPLISSIPEFFNCRIDGCYSSNDGTSMAAPHVAGVAALIWSANPEFTYKQVKKRILSSVDKVSSLEGKTVTGGRLNAYKALLGGGEVRAICTASVKGVRATLAAIQYDEIESYNWIIDRKTGKTEEKSGRIIEVDFEKTGIFSIKLVAKRKKISETLETTCAVNIPREKFPIVGQVKASIIASSIDDTAPLRIYFDGTRSIGQPVDGKIYVSPEGFVETTRITNYTWSLCKKMPHGDCTNIPLENSSQSQFFRTFSSGSYVLHLTVTDSEGLTGSTKVDINVMEWPSLPTLGESKIEGSRIGLDSEGKSIRTNTRFAGGISLHKTADYKTQQIEKNLNFLVVDVKGEIKVDSQDAGQVADILAVIMVNIQGNTSWFMLSDGGQVLPWRDFPNLSSLAAFHPNVTLDKSTQRLSIIHYEGHLEPGSYHFYFGYRLTNGTMIFTGTPPSLTIKP